MGSDATFLPEDIENYDAGHAGLHNATNDQLNWITQQLADGGRLSPDGLVEGLRASIVAGVPAASTSAQGKVELATDAEVLTGTDTARAVTPASAAATFAGKAAANIFTATQKIQGGYLHINRDTEGQTAAPELHFQAHRGRWITGIDVANAPLSRDFVPVAIEGWLKIVDGATTNGSPTLTSAAEGGFDSSWVGATITGSGIPNGTTITAVGSATSLTMSANATATATGVTVVFNTGGVGDIVYAKHRGMKTPTLGIGVTPPDGTFRLQVAASGNEPSMGTLKLLGVASQTGAAIGFYNNAGTLLFKQMIDGSVQEQTGAGWVVKGDPTNNRTVMFLHSSGSGAQFGYKFEDSTTITWRNFSGGVDYATFNGAAIYWKATQMGFFSATPVSKPTGVAVTAAGVHAALVSLGLIGA